MQRKNLNNRSLLALAGENLVASNQSSLQNQYNYANSASSRKKEYKPKMESSIVISQFKNMSQTAIKPFDSKELLKKLGLARLRKMQALVRGFIVRRTIYPKELKDYLIAQSALDLIISNVVYRECSGIIVQTVTLGSYDQDQSGEQRLIEEYLYNAVIRRVIQKEFEPIAKDAIYETAIFNSRPNITFGLNLRDPLELTLYLKLDFLIKQYVKEAAEEALREQALERRELQVMDSLILNMDVMNELYMQVIGECLLQGVGQYVCQEMFSRMVKEGARVIAQSVYDEAVVAQEDKFIQDLGVQCEEWFLQQVILELLVDPETIIGSSPINENQ